MVCNNQPLTFNTSGYISLETEIIVTDSLIDGIIRNLYVNEQTSLSAPLLLYGMSFLNQYYTLNKTRYRYLRDLIIAHEKTGIIKGGSYNCPPVSLMIGATQIVSKSTQRPIIGFRVALEISEEMRKYLEEQNIKPKRK